jgi:hypothetical protein
MHNLDLKAMASYLEANFTIAYVWEGYLTALEYGEPTEGVEDPSAVVDRFEHLVGRYERPADRLEEALLNDMLDPDDPDPDELNDMLDSDGYPRPCESSIRPCALCGLMADTVPVLVHK